MLLWHGQHRKRAYPTKAILLCGDALGRDRCRGRRLLPATNRRKVIVATDPPALPFPPGAPARGYWRRHRNSLTAKAALDFALDCREVSCPMRLQPRFHIASERGSRTTFDCALAGDCQ